MRWLGRTLALIAAVAVAGLAALAPAVLIGEAHAEPAGGSDMMIAVADTGNGRIQVFNPDGTFAFAFGSEILVQPDDVAVGTNGIVVVRDAQYYEGRIHVFHPNGTYAFGLSGGHIRDVPLGRVGPSTAVDVAPDGRIVVGERNRVQVFNPDGSFARAFGPHGSGFGAADVAGAPDGRIVVIESDRGLRTSGSDVQVFHPNGTPAISFDAPWYTSVAVAPDGLLVGIQKEFYSGSGRVHVHHPNGSNVLNFSADLAEDVAVAPDGRIVVAAGSNHSIQVFHPNGTPALRFGSYGSVQRGFDSPTDAAVAPDGRIVVAEPGSRSIRVFHPNGTFAFSFGSHSSGDDGFYVPHEVAVAPDGRIVVGDTGKQRIQVFNPDGTPVLAFGSHGTGEREFQGLGGVAVAPDGRIVVADTNNHRIQVFHPNGTFDFKIDEADVEHGDGNYRFYYPHEVAVAPDGRIVASVGSEECLSTCPSIQVFHPNGTSAFTLPDLIGPVAVAPDGRIVVVEHGSIRRQFAPNGNIVTVERDGGRLHVFAPNGSFVFASPINADVSAAAVGPDGRIVMVDATDSRIQVFNPGGTYAFSLLPDRSEGKLNGPRGVAVGPLTPPIAAVPVPVPVVIEQGEGGPILRNFTDAGDAANVTIDVAGLVEPGGPPLNGSESSTVVFPSSETTVVTSFVEVTFPPNVTAAHVPAGGQLSLRIATDVPAAEQVQAALGRNGSGPEVIVLLQRVVEVGSRDSRIMFDLPVRILLEGQAGGRAFYVDGENGTVVPIDVLCAADDDADAVHRQLAGAGECQVDSVDGMGGKIIYTYHLTKFGTVVSEGPAPQPVAAGEPPGPVAPPGEPPGPVAPMIVVSDATNDRVLVFHPNGTLAFAFGSNGGADGEFSAPSGAAVAPDGRIVVADTGNGRIQVFHPNGTFDFAFSGALATPGDVAVAPDGRIVVADSANGSIRVFHPNGTDAFTIHDLVWHVAVAPDGRIVATSMINYKTPRIQVFHPNGTFDFAFGTLGPGDGEFSRPGGVAVAPDGRIVVEGNSGRIQVFHPNGTFDFAFGTSSINVADVAVAPDGRIAVAHSQHSRIQVFHPNGTAILAFGSVADNDGPGEFSRPGDVAVAPDGRIVVADAGNHRIQVLHPNGMFALAFGAPGYGTGQVNYPGGVAVAPDGRIVVADTHNNRIQVFHPNGTFDFAFGSLGTGDGEFYYPSRVAVSPLDGRIVVGPDRYQPILGIDDDRIEVFHPNGTFDFAFGTTGDGPGEFNRPGGVAVAPDGRIVVADTDNHRIQVFHPDGTFMLAFETVGGVGVGASPNTVAVGQDGRIVVGTQLVSHGGVFVFGADGTLDFEMGLTDSSVVPSGVAVAPDGRIVVADANNNLIEVFHPDGELDFEVGPSHRTPFWPTRIAFGPVPPPSTVPQPTAVVPSSPVVLVVEPNGGGSGLYNHTSAGDAANLTISVAGLTGMLDEGTTSRTATFPPTETVVITSFAEVSFPPGVTASHVPADGMLALRISSEAPPPDDQVQGALAYGGSGRVELQRVVEVGAGPSGPSNGVTPRVTFDQPVRILLEGQAGGRAFYIQGAGGAITPIDAACAADDTTRVHRQLAGAGECQIDSDDGTDKIIYTYHLTRFGTVRSDSGALPPVVHTCSARLGTPDLGVSATPGGHSQLVVQELINSGSLPFAGVELEATPWYIDWGGSAPPPPAAGHPSLPASISKVFSNEDTFAYEGVAINEAVVARGLEGGDVASLGFVADLTPYNEVQGSTIEQYVTYLAQCSGR